MDNQPSNNKKFYSVGIIIVLLVLVYFVFFKKTNTDTTVTENQITEPLQAPVPADIPPTQN